MNLERPIEAEEDLAEAERLGHVVRDTQPQGLDRDVDGLDGGDDDDRQPREDLA